jgi:hypothetical protein
MLLRMKGRKKHAVPGFTHSLEEAPAATRLPRAVQDDLRNL